MGALHKNNRAVEPKLFMVKVRLRVSKAELKLFKVSVRVRASKAAKVIFC